MDERGQKIFKLITWIIILVLIVVGIVYFILNIDYFV